MCNNDAIEALLLEKTRLLKRITELQAEVHAKQAYFLHLLEQQQEREYLLALVQTLDEQQQREILEFVLETTEKVNLLTADFIWQAEQSKVKT